MKKTKSVTLIFCLLIVSCSILNCQDSKSAKIIINHTHLDQLYEEIVVDNTTMAIIHIYSEYPNYKWVDDDDEGIACIDDVARAAIYYAEDFRLNGSLESYDKTKKLVEYILYMQSDNSFYYNFIFPDYTINKEHQNSINEPGWWSWRALWALVETYKVIEIKDEITAKKMSKQIYSTVKAIKAEMVMTDDEFEISGIKLPTWLPHKSASDQAALLVISLSRYSTIFEDDSVIPIIKKLSNGIAMMQIQDKSFSYDGAILSWQNVWHGWGNSQSYALLIAYEITKEANYLETALYEIDNFYTRIKTKKMLNEFSVSKTEQKYNLEKDLKFSQIAYSIRPMIFATLKAYEITEEAKYSELAGAIASWFFCNNISGYKMYYEDSGLCYDGIISETEVNKNSGAESTIETLLSFQKISKCRVTTSNLKNNEQ